MRITRALVLAATPLIVAPRGEPASRAFAAREVERVVPNDNRAPAGRLVDGVVTLRLDARLASWHPDGDSAPGAVVPAFAEAGDAPRIPGPLIRVPSGSVVEVTVRNQVPGAPLSVFGLVDRASSARPPRDSGLTVASGTSRTVRFRLESPGTYFYWGTTTGRPLAYRTLEDAQLTGAIVVDPPGRRANDRVFVMGMWTDTLSRAYTQRKRLLAVINGRSWPHTERLRYAVGDSARWRVINGSTDAHPMHLHGFYFRVDARGDGLVDTRYDGVADSAFTENVSIGSTLDLTWVPERVGNWLFHCHIPEHFARRGPLGMAAAPGGHGPHANHANDGMGGLVLGVTVDSAAVPAAASAAEPEETRRRLRLLVRRNSGGSDEAPYFSFALQEGGTAPPPDSGLRYGPPLVLTRGQPVSITVVNALAEPTSIHWHGIELESYFDGVAGFSGVGKRIAPLVAPGDSFVVRFTPPRSGTFIYHTHLDEERQVLAGLVGPLIVVEPGERYDPDADRVVLLTSPTSFAEQRTAVWVGANLGPGPLTLRAGVPYRLRFINMTVRRPRLLVQLMQGDSVRPWRVLAKDAIPLAATRDRQPTFRQVAIGETLDLGITPALGDDLRIDVRIGGLPQAPHPLMGTLPIRVVP